MFGTGSRLGVRLQLAALVAQALAFLAFGLLSPGVLLLEPDAATAVLIESAWTQPVAVVVAAMATWLTLRRFSSVLGALDRDDTDAVIDPDLVASLHALPRRWTVRFAVRATAVWALTILPGLRPTIIDRDTQISVIALAATIMVATALPLYVVARAVVGETLERVGWKICEEALRRRRGALNGGPDDAADWPRSSRQKAWRRLLRGPFPQEGRVAGRLAFAVGLPVALIALATSLLANAHVRAYEARRRREDAYALARGILDAEGVGAGVRGRASVQRTIEAAHKLGFDVTLRRRSDDGDAVSTSAPGGDGAKEAATDLNDTSETATTGGTRTLSVVLEQGTASIRYSPTSDAAIGPTLELYALVGGIFIGIATLLGRAFGRAVAYDLAGASREVRLLGTRDVLRGGTRVAGPARFYAIADLGVGIESVAERFGEFARGREQMIDARESAQKMRDLFLASMSHDLRSPLNGILGFVALLQNADLSPSQHESLEIIERRGRELLELIENILDAAKIEAGKLELSRDWTMASELLTEVVRRGRELSIEKAASSPAKGPTTGSRTNPRREGVEVIGELQPGIPPLYVDGPRLTHALINVVANAVKFCDQGVVRVRISLGFSRPAIGAPLGEAGERALRIEVADQGRGIPERELAQIFDAFRQPLRARRHGGLGLGLSMTRALVELHGGSVDVASSPEHGSVFTLSIPTSLVVATHADMGVEMALDDMGLDGPLDGLADSEREITTQVNARARKPSTWIDTDSLTPVRRKSTDNDPTVEMPALEVPDSREPDALDARFLTPPPRPAAGTPPPTSVKVQVAHLASNPQATPKPAPGGRKP